MLTTHNVPYALQHIRHVFIEDDRGIKGNFIFDRIIAVDRSRNKLRKLELRFVVKKNIFAGGCTIAYKADGFCTFIIFVLNGIAAEPAALTGEYIVGNEAAVENGISVFVEKLVVHRKISSVRVCVVPDFYVEKHPAIGKLFYLKVLDREAVRFYFLLFVCGFMSAARTQGEHHR